MRSFFASIAGIIVVIFLVAIVIVFIGWGRVPDMLANNLSKKMKVYVGVGNIKLGWGEIKVNKFEIGNPPKSVLQQAFTCKEIIIDAPFSRYLNKNIVIDEINVNDVYLDLEFDSASGTSGNWSRIMSNFQSSSSPKTASERTVLIHRLVFNTINTDVLYQKDGGKVKHLPTIDRIVLTDVSSEGGFPIQQITSSVLGQMLQSVFLKQNLKNMLQNILQSPTNPIQQFIEPFKGLFGADAEE